MLELFYPLAEQDPGPRAKRWMDENTVTGVILHSMEGYWAAAREMLMGAPEVSWHFSVLKDGRVIQAYALNECPWHAGSHAANARLVGVEHEGIVGEPLTPAQVAASVALTRWIAEQGRWAMQRAAGHGQTLWEHNEVSVTTCPNGRIPWGAYVPAPKEADVEVKPFMDSAVVIKALLDIFKSTADAASGGDIGEADCPKPGKRRIVLDLDFAELADVPHP